MWKSINPGLFLLLLIAVATSVQARTWCSPDETVLMNGWVGTLKGDQFSGKGLLSLCAKPAKPPYVQVTYRFGSKTPEMVFSAPEDGGMFLDSQQILPRATVDVLYFRKGDVTYALTDCNGMHCGIRTFRLMVFKGAKPIASFSAEPDRFDRHIDFLDEIKGSSIKALASGLNFDER